MRIVMTVEAELEKKYVDGDDNKLIKDLIGQNVAVKSGLYENLLWGNVSKAEVIRKHRGNRIKTAP
jgi:hypothetical protein